MPEHTLDANADSVTREIVAATADATGRGPENLPPLYDAVDPDALNALVNRPPHVGHGATEVEVTFGFAGCTVTVSATDEVNVSAETTADSAAIRLPADD